MDQDLITTAAPSAGPSGGSATRPPADSGPAPTPTSGHAAGAGTATEGSPVPYPRPGARPSVLGAEPAGLADPTEPHIIRGIN